METEQTSQDVAHPNVPEYYADSLSMSVQLDAPPLPEWVQQTRDLRNRPEDAESGFVPPSHGASLRMIALLNALQEAPLLTGISDDGEGGLEAYWMGSTRHVQLNVPSTPGDVPTMFWDGEGTYRLEPLTSLGKLSARLAWLEET